MFLGSVHHHLGVLAATCGDMTRADAELKAALEVHTELSSSRWIELTSQALAGLGR